MKTIAPIFLSKVYQKNISNICFKIFYNNHNTFLESREMGLHDRIEIIENPKNCGLKKDDDVTFNFM